MSPAQMHRPATDAITKRMRRDGAVDRLLAETDTDPMPFPWHGLEQRLEREGAPTLRLAGYGALMHPAQAASVFPARTRREPVMVFGAIRAFEYNIADRNFHRYGPIPADNRRAALNAVSTGNPDDAFNAVLIRFDAGSLDRLRAREEGYDLARAVCRPWSRPDAEPAVCHVLSANNARAEHHDWTRPDLLPCTPYAEVCRAGCREVDDEFESVFLETALLGDHATPLRDHLRLTP